ncbi:exotoxin beta-grasp domain-containing protein [Staphylococcus lutrae]|uniref:Superantigen-like protein n=1 Tax=Staphylococcus lutrae TaxID=155085 RepID=A0AAC9WJQ1_9STAP|nr:hypothetical protein [Staphylococcus lutrae]ARJ51333.1 hypothetical protein B5P37_08430 [Staphylococcus lutrae]PNZ35843.1 exotoxin [Staphylococcus lutrae]
MKITTLFKATLVAGILATGGYTSTLLTSTAQATVQAPETAASLRAYYLKPSFTYSNLSGHRYDSDRIDFVTKHHTHASIKLVGQDLQKYHEKNKTYEGLNIFVVPEGTGKQATLNSIGGITKKNEYQYYDYVSRPMITVNQHFQAGVISTRLTNFTIAKEEISLKELDFKLRQILVKQYGLYQKELSHGTIVIKTGDNPSDKYTFELDKKLQAHRMSDVIDSRTIKSIDIKL